MSALGRGRRVGARLGGPSSVTEIALDGIRSRIQSGQLPQGAHIGEQQLADDLGVSRAALREALRTLERDGLVVSAPRVGSSVVSLTLRDAYEIVTLREHLEDLAISLGVPSNRTDRVDALEHAVVVMEANAVAGYEVSARTDGLAFHAALIGLAGHGKLEAAFAGIVHPLSLMMGLNRQVTARDESLFERAARHRRVLSLVQAGDPDAVRTELRNHSTTGFLGEGILPIGTADEEILAWRDRRLK